MDVGVPGLQPARKRDPQPHTRKELSSVNSQDELGGRFFFRPPDRSRILHLDFFISALGGSPQRPKHTHTRGERSNLLQQQWEVIPLPAPWED